MDVNNHKSSLRKSAAGVGPTVNKTQIKRRISFSGKNSVRVFHDEEEPKTWSNSYEVSDYLNGKETTCAQSTERILEINSKEASDNKENVESLSTLQTLQVQKNHQQKNCANFSNNNLTVLGSSKDLINMSYQNQNSKIYKIENSVDVTLHDREMKFYVEKVTINQTNKNSCSFSLEDFEEDTRPVVLSERTIDFMQELRNSTLNVRGSAIGICAVIDENNGIFNDMKKGQCQDFTSNKYILSKELIKVYNNEFSISGKEQISSANINAENCISISPAKAIQLSPNQDQKNDKRNDDSLLTQNTNKTQNISCQMEIESEIFSDLSNNVNNLKFENVEPNIKQRKTNNFNEDIEMFSEKCDSAENKTIFRPTMCFGQQIVQLPGSINQNSKQNRHIENFLCRRTINFNNSIEFSPKTLTKNLQENKFFTRHGALPNIESRHTIYFNQPKEIHRNKVKLHLNGNTVLLNKGINVSFENLPQEPISIKKSIVPVSIDNKNLIDLEQEKLMRYEAKHEKKIPLLDSASKEMTKKRKNVSFSFHSVKNMSLSPESSSPLIPLENNEEIKCENINLFLNSPRTSIINRKEQNFISNLNSKNTYQYDDADLQLSSDDIFYCNLESDELENFSNYNICSKPIEIKSNTNDINRGDKNSKLISSQTVANFKDCNNFVSLSDTTDISNEIERKELLERTTNFKNDVEYIELSESIKPKILKNTIYTNGIISNEFIEIESQLQNAKMEINIMSERMDKKNYNSIPVRKTIYFNDDILLDKQLTDLKKIQNEKTGDFSRNSNPTSIKTEENACDICTSKTIDTSISSGKTLYFNNDISFENDSKYIGAQNSNYETYKLKETLQSMDQEVYPSRENVYIADDIDMTVNENISEISSRTNCAYLRKNMVMDIVADVLDTNTCNEKKSRTEKHVFKESKYPAECMDLKFNGKELKKSNYENMVNSTLDYVQTIVNTGKATEYENQRYEIRPDEAKTFLFSENSHKTNLFNQSFKPTKNLQFSVLKESSSALTRKINRSKLTNKQDNLLITPMKCNSSNINQNLLYITPRPSLLEFTALEKKAKEEGQLQTNLNISLVPTENFNKRLSTILTPIMLAPKKRRTILFDDCLPNEFEISPIFSNSEKKNIEEHINKYTTKDDEIELSRTVINESMVQNPSKEIKSRIPIPMNCETISNKYKQENFQLDMDCDNLAESIQLTRRATFKQNSDTFKGPIDLDAELVVEEKPSIFEGNPITISDVSIFFETEKQIIKKPVIRSTLEKTETTLLNTLETQKKCLESRCVNLSLDDIDKTSLSLVRLSYEDVNMLGLKKNAIEVQSPPNMKIENIENLKSNLHNINYVKKISPVCRKCKRCQETFLNESSSISELPNLGIDRLRWLRNQPAIADINRLWHRESLEWTTNNNINILDGDRQLNPFFNNEAEDKKSPVTKHIHKCENDMISFEMDLLKKQTNKGSSGKLPFVLRLDTLLRKNKTNWIFDHQMQYRGILLFTHRKILTSVLSVTYTEVDPLGQNIRLKSVKLEKSRMLQKNWKPIDFVVDFQLKLNLPFNLQWMNKGSNEAGIFEMLQEIDRVYLNTVKITNNLNRICFSQQASIERTELRTYVRKLIRKIVESSTTDFKYVEDTEIKIELLNLNNLSFKNIIYPRLHHFREEIHLLPTGLQFLQEFLQNPLNYFKHC